MFNLRTELGTSQRTAATIANQLGYDTESAAAASARCRRVMATVVLTNSLCPPVLLRGRVAGGVPGRAQDAFR